MGWTVTSDPFYIVSDLICSLPVWETYISLDSSVTQ